MFYYPAVLKRHTGCFSTIWLVATKGIRVTRRDFLKVNVTKTCDDIMDYLLERVEPPRADLPRPRFSLYLSSQLQYGVIVVFHRQCAILLEETQYVVEWLLKQKTVQKKNDLDDRTRPAPLLRDMLYLMDQTEGAPDPQFGDMYMQEDLPSPSALLQGHLRDRSPPRSQEHAEAARSPPVQQPLHRDTTASPDAITLREPEPVSIPLAEYEGMELADHHVSTIDLLLAETDQFPEGEMLREREVERGGEAEKDRTREQTESTAELQPTTTTLSSEDQLLLPQDEPHLPPETAAGPVQQLTPVSAPELPRPAPDVARGTRRKRQREQVYGADEPQQRRKWRRRQLIFADVETQLSHEEQQQQISDLHTQTAAPAILPHPSALGPSAVELLNTPCTSLLAEDLRLLWRQAAVITPISGSDLQIGERGPESTDSEERERERAEGSPKEIPREAAEAEQLDVSAVTSLHLEGSDQMEGSREISPMFTPDRERSVVSRSVSKLQDIPEEMLGDLQRSPMFLSELEEFGEDPVSFLSLIPQGASRRTVSRNFARLLEDLSSGKLQAEQREPYSDIFFFRPNVASQF